MRMISTKAFAAAFLLEALLLAGLVSFYASGHPDGLEFVAGERGFLDTATDHAAAAVSPFADYAVEGVSNARLSGGLAGLVGCVLVLLLATGVSRIVRAGGHPSDDE